MQGCDARGAQTLSADGASDNLVNLTRLGEFPVTDQSLPPRRTPSDLPNHWHLQTAKARFSELVRRVRSDGPQHVTVHGRDEVVVISAEEFRRLKGGVTGQALIDALQSSPHPDTDIEPERGAMPVRDIDL
jgi:prevent-host-death family protein